MVTSLTGRGQGARAGERGPAGAAASQDPGSGSSHQVRSRGPDDPVWGEGQCPPGLPTHTMGAHAPPGPPPTPERPQSPARAALPSGRWDCLNAGPRVGRELGRHCPRRRIVRRDARPHRGRTSVRGGTAREATAPHLMPCPHPGRAAELLPQTETSETSLRPLWPLEPPSCHLPSQGWEGRTSPSPTLCISRCLMAGIDHMVLQLRGRPRCDLLSPPRSSTQAPVPWLLTTRPSRRQRPPCPPSCCKPLHPRLHFPGPSVTRHPRPNCL